MNKDVIYIEPEDDITSIIRKLNASEHKLVALVPPKRIGVLRSAVNTRLVAKNAKQAEKTVVIVTTDPSLTKLSAAAGIPVADTLQSRPKMPENILGAPAKEAIPSEITIEEDKSMVIEDNSTDEPVENSVENSEKTEKNGPRLAKNHSVDDEINSVELEGKDYEKKDGKKKLIPDFDRYKKWIIIGSVAGVGLILFLVWAFIFAPYAKIMVAIRTTGNNFSENVSFTTKADGADPEKGIFYLEQQTYKAENSVDLSATGEKEVGEKASGSIVLTLNGVTQNTPVSLPAGTVFTNKSTGLKYNLAKDVTFSTKGESEDNCKTITDYEEGASVLSCNITATLAINASELGDKYNLAAGNVNWEVPVTIDFKATNNEISGGSSKKIKILQQSDIDSAKSKLSQTAENEGKQKLLALFGNDMYKIESSYKMDAGSPVSTPAVGEEVKDGTTPKLTQTTTFTMYGVDISKLAQFIKAKTNSTIANDQKIYDVGTPFLENYHDENNTVTAKLKSTTQTGPSVTEEEILEKSKGRKVGEVQSLIKSINGVSSVKIDTSFFWVKYIPDDANKISIELKVEE